MYIEVDAGCQDVPEAIWPIHITFFSVTAPTFTPISLPDMTNNEPSFFEPVSIPGMASIVPTGEGLAVGVGIFIFCCEEACGLGEGAGDGDGAGICIPGMFICVCGEGEGEAAGVCILGLLVMS